MTPRKKITKKTMGKYTPHKSLWIVLGLIIVGAAVLILRQLTQKPESAQIAYIGNSAGVVTLALTPDTYTVEPGKTATVTLTASVGGSHRLSGVQGDLAYDPACGEVNLTQGDMLTQTLVPFKKSNGHLTFVYGAKMDSKGVTGNGTVAQIAFTPNSVGTCKFTFADTTFAAVTDMDTNAISSAADIVITVAKAQAASVPTPSPLVTSVSVSPTPKDTPQKSVESPNPGAQTESQTVHVRRNISKCDSLTISWEKVANTSGYLIEIDDSPNFDSPISSGKLDDGTLSHMFSNLKNGTKYYARITQTRDPDHPKYAKFGPFTTLSLCHANTENQAVNLPKNGADARFVNGNLISWTFALFRTWLNR